MGFFCNKSRHSNSEACRQAFLYGFINVSLSHKITSICERKNLLGNLNDNTNMNIELSFAFFKQKRLNILEQYCYLQIFGFAILSIKLKFKILNQEKYERE